MLPVERWVIFYGDGSTAAWGCGDGCDEHTVHVDSWAKAPAFGVNCVVYYRADHVHFQEVGNDAGVVVYEGIAEGAPQPVKMPLWTDGESYWRVHDAARRTFTPEGGDD